ncbi:MAG TPA: hypothetical protein VGH19_17155 [Verrucomicrobiae bacterium]
MMSTLESKLRRLAAALDATALEALASKGLLRRAQKDLERQVSLSVTGEKDGRLEVQVEHFTVRIPESGPATATCSCPASGVCQHIVTATLFLQRGVATAEMIPSEPAADVTTSEPAPETDLMALTPEMVERWAGKAVFRAGQKLAVLFPAQVSHERGLRVHFPALNAGVHLVSGGNLDGMIVAGGKGDGRDLIVAAVIAFQRAHGKEWVLPTEAESPSASSGAPRTRAEVLGSCHGLLAETLVNGLSRITDANRQRWLTLAVSALGVNLPRLALSLRGIGDEAALTVARDARSDLTRLLGRLAQAHALCTALENGGENPRADLVGLHRTRYDEIGHVDLLGAAAWPWRTASGYEGLTILFWDPSAKQWNSWSESRPAHQLGDFKPAARFTQPGPWEGTESPQQLARSAFRLMNARRNPANRLSSSTKSRVLVTGVAALENQSLLPVKQWSHLEQQFKHRAAIGLKESNPLDFIFALKPATWRERHFETVAQQFSWALEDSQGEMMALEIPYDELNRPGIEFLESIAADSLQGAMVIGRIQHGLTGLALFPYTFHLANGKILHLYLDQAKTTALEKSEEVEEPTELFGMDEEIDNLESASPTIARLLAEVDDGLLTMAESGLGALNHLHLERIRQTASRVARMGLTRLSISLTQFAHHPQSDSLLRCAYISLTCRRAMALTAS